MRSIALLRGINVGGNNKVPMAELRAACLTLGWRRVDTYIQSGNVLFESDASAPECEKALEGLIAARFGLTIPVLVRTAAEWEDYVLGNPFTGPAEAEPNLLMLCLSKERLREQAESEIAARAGDEERVRVVGQALWIHYAGGAGRSKLTPALLDRLAGSPVTARNWRTALKIRELAQE